MHISEQITEQEWEAFLLQQPHAPFLQSWHMRSLHKLTHEETHVIAMRDDAGTVQGVALCVVVRARRGHYLFLPYGPVCTPAGWAAFSELTAYLVALGKRLHVDFIRSSPFIPNTPDSKQTYAKTGWRNAPIHLLAEHIWWLDITPPEEVLLKNMRKTMRNLIRKAEKDGVTIRKTSDPRDTHVFIDIHQSTVQRHGFVPYTNAYFQAQMDAFGPQGNAVEFIGDYEGKPIAAAIMMYYGDSGAYHHGASLSEYNRIPASYLLQWEAIKEAKRRGCTTYNFWGIVPEDRYHSKFLKRPHPWVGLSKFKTGFGGSQHDILHCQDYPLTMKYHLTRLIETVRRIKRGH